MAAEKITAESRTEFGKGAARRIRREVKIPAVVYGHGKDTMHLTLPAHETTLALRHGGANSLLELVFGDGTSQLALTKQVQVDPIRRKIEHIDFVAITKGEKVTVDVLIHLVGEAAKETLVNADNTVEVEAEATNIPEWIEIDIEGLEAGTQIFASELVLPTGSELLTDPETLIVNITQQQSQEDLEAELEEAEAEAGIEREESDEDEAEAASEGDAEAGDAEASADDE